MQPKSETNPGFFLQIRKRLFGIIFRFLYHEFAWTYDVVAFIVSGGQWNKWVREVLVFCQGENILELGYGPGHFQIAAIEQGFKVFGIDESGYMSRQANHRIKAYLQAQIPPKTAQIGLSRGVSQYLPFQNDVFDTIISTFPSEYAFHSQTHSEVTRVLKSGGNWIILMSAWPQGSSITSSIQRFWLAISGAGSGSEDPVNEKILQRFPKGTIVKKCAVNANILQILIYHKTATETEN